MKKCEKWKKLRKLRNAKIIAQLNVYADTVVPENQPAGYRSIKIHTIHYLATSIFGQLPDYRITELPLCQSQDKFNSLQFFIS